MSKINLLLLYGGKSGEHEISLISAASVLANLDNDKYNITPVGIDKEGCFFQNDYQELLAFNKALPVVTKNSKPLANLLLNGQLAIETDVIFPVVHGPLYEDGALQGLLELANIAYVGCPVLASAIGMDKDIARRLACQNGIKAAKYRLLDANTTAEEKDDFCKSVSQELGWPLFVKPCSMGSSVGIHKVKNMAELKNAVSDALRYDEAILVEEFIKGREIELAVLENRQSITAPKVSTAGEICVKHPDGFYSYTAKYLESEQTELHIPAKIDAATLKKLQEVASQIFINLKCRGLARIDFFLNEETGNIYFNEINSLPGFTSISMYPKLWQAVGLGYSELLDELIYLARMRKKHREQLVTSYQ